MVKEVLCTTHKGNISQHLGSKEVKSTQRLCLPQTHPAQSQRTVSEARNPFWASTVLGKEAQQRGSKQRMALLVVLEASVLQCCLENMQRPHTERYRAQQGLMPTPPCLRMFPQSSMDLGNLHCPLALIRGYAFFRVWAAEMRPRTGQTQRKMMSLDNAKTSAREDGSDLELLGPAPPLC